MGENVNDRWYRTVIFFGYVLSVVTSIVLALVLIKR